MKTLLQDINKIKIEKEFAWFITMVFLVTALPLFKNAIIGILMKLYDLFIQRPIER